MTQKHYESLVEKTLERETIFQGNILTLERDSVELIDGTTATREVVRHNGGVAILALSAEKEVTLVEQFRYPFGEVIAELPAGKLDKKEGKIEDHRLAAQRELEEETGLTGGNFVYLGYILASPGFSDEILHMYLVTDLKQGETSPDEDEFLNIVKMSFDTLLSKVMSGEIVDGKTVATVLKAKYYLEQNPTSTET